MPRPMIEPPPTDGTVRSALSGMPAVARVLPGYVAGLARDVGLLGRHLAQGRRPELRRVAHQLRGSGGAYGFPDVTRLATAVDGGTPLPALAADVAALADLIRRIDGYDPAGEADPAAAA
jgi:hypothetical protein